MYLVVWSAPAFAQTSWNLYLQLNNKNILIIRSIDNEGIGAGFVEKVEDDKITKILGLPYVKEISALEQPYEKPERSHRILDGTAQNDKCED
ncbi:MAG: hypothetical protein ABWY25_07970 [Paenisporosarcina sp.]